MTVMTVFPMFSSFSVIAKFSLAGFGKTEKDFVPVILGNFSPQYRTESFYPDVVTKNGLRDYIGKQKYWVKSLRKRIVDHLTGIDLRKRKK